MLAQFVHMLHVINKENVVQLKWMKFVVAVSMIAGGAAQATVVATNVAYVNFDGSSGIRSLGVTQQGIIRDVNISIEFSKCDDPATGPLGSSCIGTGNSNNNEIVFRLIGPNGTTVSLVEAGSYSGSRPGAGRVFVTYDDEAVIAVGGPVSAGTFRPIRSLSAFDGMHMGGTWGLFVQDLRTGDPLEYYSSSLDITFDAFPSPVPEPASLAIVGLGLLAMRAFRSKARS